MEIDVKYSEFDWVEKYQIIRPGSILMKVFELAVEGHPASRELTLVQLVTYPRDSSCFGWGGGVSNGWD